MNVEQLFFNIKQLVMKFVHLWDYGVGEGSKFEKLVIKSNWSLSSLDSQSLDSKTSCQPVQREGSPREIFTSEFPTLKNVYLQDISNNSR